TPTSSAFAPSLVRRSAASVSPAATTPATNLNAPATSKETVERSAAPSAAEPQGVVANVPRKALADAQMQWSNAWKDRDISTYLQSYSPDFKPENGASHDAWVAQRTAALQNKKN